MLASILVATAGAIASAMGLAHLVFTLFTHAFHPCDVQVEDAMKTAPLNFSRRMLMWPSWVGYNAGHALGAIWFGLIFAYLALAHGTFLFQSHFLVALGTIGFAAYLILAYVYWFYVPLLGIAVAFACYIAGIVVAYTR